MFLKSLDIQGFKSFADKTSLEFHSGITSIVGPNGSGKSNISDAVRWVLGEQSAKLLRGTKMEDIIFSGTVHRKPLGFSEVSLTIDNSDNALPMEYNEITITRRVFRSGESEYFINRTSCRLKDIYELFLDTGIGRDGYSIIGQGRIDEILSTRSEDRRAIFEEASGIMKYKVRKLEAERKLEHMSQNILRINDIINELELQLEPLKLQSEKAKKFLTLREKLRDIEVSLYLENITRLKERLSEYVSQSETINNNIRDEIIKLNRFKREHDEKLKRGKILEDKMEGTRKEFYSLEGSLEKCYSDIKINSERKIRLNENILRLQAETEELYSKLEGIDTDYKNRQNKLEYLKNQHLIYSEKLADYEAKMENLHSTLDEFEKNIEKMKQEMSDIIDELSEIKIEINSLHSNIRTLEKRNETIDKETYQTKLDLDNEGMKNEETGQSLYNVKLELKALDSELDNNIKLRKLSEKELGELKKNQNDVKNLINNKISRYKMLDEMEKKLEGYSRSVKHLLGNTSKSSELKGIHGAVAQLVSTSQKYETAIEMALAGAMQNIITDTEEDAKHAIEFLRNNKLGRATFLPVSSVKARDLENNYIQKLKSYKGFCGIASDLVKCENKYKNIISNLLGRVAVVENMDCGISIARSFSYGFRIVTLDGDVINTSGAMSGGSNDSSGGGLLGRHREIDSLKNEVKELENQDNDFQEKISVKIEHISSILEMISDYEKKIKNLEIIKIKEESQLLQIEENIKKYRAKIDMLNTEKHQNQKEIIKLGEELDALIIRQKDMEKEIENKKAVIEQNRMKHKEDQAERDSLFNDITDHKISVNSILESIEGVKDVIERIVSDKNYSSNLIEKKKGEIERYYKDIEIIDEKITALEKLTGRYEEEKSGKTFEIDSITEEKEVINEELEKLNNNYEECNNKIQIMKEELNRIEVRKARAESEMEALQNRMWDEYEVTYNNAMELKKEIESMAWAQREIEELKNGIKELGDINVSAIEEYVKTKERYEFMILQKTDMENAEIKLRRVISEMVAIMKKQFLEQFSIINGHFNDVFRELFNGGKAELIITDNNNVLESGIEIEVSPPGKKLQNMMLLSGGERAFTAIALLFAILKLRPAPFCILDEIEAALDDSNVTRFANYLRKFSEETQFVIVTHRKGTMECSNTLYGVTMEEHGISKIVSIKMEELAS